MSKQRIMAISVLLFIVSVIAGIVFWKTQLQPDVAFATGFDVM